MKSIAVAFAAGVFLFWPPAPALADEASKNAKIEEMMRLTHADTTIQQFVDQIKTMQIAQLSKMDMPSGEREAADEMQQKVMALISDRLRWEKVKPAFVKLYADTYTEEEIASIVEFYKSPAGKAMLEKMPVLMQRSMAVGQQLTGDLAPEIKRITEELKQKYNKK
jgi:uncharacterized protein